MPRVLRESSALEKRCDAQRSYHLAGSAPILYHEGAVAVPRPTDGCVMLSVVCPYCRTPLPAAEPAEPVRRCPNCDHVLPLVGAAAPVTPPSAGRSFPFLRPPQAADELGRLDC